MRRIRTILAHICEWGAKRCRGLRGEYIARNFVIGPYWVYIFPGTCAVTGYFVHIDEVEKSMVNIVEKMRIDNSDMTNEAIARFYANHLYDHMEARLSKGFEECEV